MVYNGDFYQECFNPTGCENELWYAVLSKQGSNVTRRIQECFSPRDSDYNKVSFVPIIRYHFEPQARIFRPT